MYSYKTIQAPSEGLYKEKGSKFLSFAYPVESEAGIKAIISEIQKKFHDARHHCFAWMLGPEKKNFRAFDDGEPNHSAGDPILNQLRSKDLTNILIIVVRYFGGVKLGMSGLITAYKSAAGDALNNSRIVEKQVVRKAVLRYDYVTTPEVMKLVKDFELLILTQEFADSCKISVQFRLKDLQELLEKIRLLQNKGSRLRLEMDQ